MSETRTLPQTLTILQRARDLAAMTDELHAESIERTLPANALTALARDVARRAEVLLAMIELDTPQTRWEIAEAQWSPADIAARRAEGRPVLTDDAEPWIEQERRRHS